MTKLTDMINKLTESEMDDKVLDSFEMTKEEKERTAGLALNKIRAEKEASGAAKGKIQESGGKVIGFGKRWSRKFVAVAAAMVVVLAFGVVAYANGWFNLGVIDDGYDKYELTAVEDSAQYKAAKEVMDYDNSLSNEELVARDNGKFEDTGKTNDKEKSITFRAPSEKENEVLKKYDLKFERTHYYVDSAKKAFDEVGIANFLGDFWDINELESNDNYVYDDGYIYTDMGSVTVMGGGETSDDPVYWEMHLTPRNVYISPWSAFVSSSERENPELAEWDFTTDDGYYVKAASYKVNMPTTLENGETEKRAYRNFHFLLITETHTMDMYYDIWIDDKDNDMSNKEFEKMIDKFDFSKLG